MLKGAAAKAAVGAVVVLGFVVFAGLASAPEAPTGQAQARATSSIDSPRKASPRAPRYVLCGKQKVWVPVDYNGCLIQFNAKIKKRVGFIIRTDFINDDVLSGVLLYDYTSPICSREGGTADGICRWTETFGHFIHGPGGNDEWQCRILAYVGYSPTLKTRVRKGRVWALWKLNIQPRSPVPMQGGTWPMCGQDPDTHAWISL